MGKVYILSPEETVSGRRKRNQKIVISKEEKFKKKELLTYLN